MCSVLSVFTQVACNTEPVQVDPDSRRAYFDLEHWAAYQDSMLSGEGLNKRIEVNGVVQEASIEQVDWEAELATFAQANINKPALIGRYSVDSMRDAFGSLRLDYQALDEDLKTRRVRVNCKSNCNYENVLALEVEAGMSSVIADTEQRLSWRPDSFSISSRQDVLLVSERKLKIDGRRQGSAQDLPKL